MRLVLANDKQLRFWNKIIFLAFNVSFLVEIYVSEPQGVSEREANAIERNCSAI